MLSKNFRLDIEPKGQKRGRVGVLKTQTGVRGMVFKDKDGRDFEATLRAMVNPFRFTDAAGVPVVLDCPIELVIVAVLPRPKSMCGISARTGQPLKDPARRWATGKPDGDNIDKALMDAMCDWWTDDARVVSRLSLKQIAAFGEAPHYEVRVVQLADGGACKVDLGRIPPDVSTGIWLAGIPF